MTAADVYFFKPVFHVLFSVQQFPPQGFSKNLHRTRLWEQQNLNIIIMWEHNQYSGLKVLSCENEIYYFSKLIEILLAQQMDLDTSR